MSKFLKRAWPLLLALIAAVVWLKQPVTAFHGGYMTPSEPFITLTRAQES